MNLKFLSKIGIIRYHIKQLNRFDDITKFRLFMTGIINIQFALLTPLLGELYGSYLTIETLGVAAATVLALVSIIRTIGLKLSPKIMKTTSFSNIFKIHVITFTLYVFTAILYFYNIKLMVWFEVILGVIDIVILNAYSMSLNNYINYFYTDSYTNFSNYSNDIKTESFLLGAILSTLISYFLGNGYLVISFLIIGIIVIYYNFKNWNIMKKYDFKYMLKYMKKIKK